VRSLRAVVLDEGKAAGAQDVIIDPVHCPIEVGEAHLIVAHVLVRDGERGTRRKVPLPDMTRKNFGGLWKITSW